MMLTDVIKNDVIEGFSGSLSAVDMVLGLVAALGASLFILFIYQRTMRQVTLNRSFCISLMLVCAISAMMVLTITSNLALSLGMVGALSIVRFRTAVKDASDTAFMFWSVAAGITAGAGFYLLTVLGCLLVGAVCVIAVQLFQKTQKPFLLVVRAESVRTLEQAKAELESAGVRYEISSLVESAGHTEMICQMAPSADDLALVRKLREIAGVNTVSLVDCQKN